MDVVSRINVESSGVIPEGPSILQINPDGAFVTWIDALEGGFDSTCILTVASIPRCTLTVVGVTVAVSVIRVVGSLYAKTSTYMAAKTERKFPSVMPMPISLTSAESKF